MSIKRIGSIKDYTPNFKIIIPRFDLATWHDYIEENFRNIDALFFNLFGINNYSGSWKQITEYKQGQVIFIGDDLDINGNVTEFSGRLVKVLVDHTTDNSDYFNIFYNLHPEYYELFADASTAQIYAQQAQNSANTANVIKEETGLIRDETNLLKNETNIAINEFNEEFTEKSNTILEEMQNNVNAVETNKQITENNAEKSRIWAEGTDEEVVLLNGEHSSKNWNELCKQSVNSAKISEENAKISEINAQKFASTIDTSQLAKLYDNNTFTGINNVPTPAVGDNSTQIANTEWVLANAGIKISYEDE